VAKEKCTESEGNEVIKRSANILPKKSLRNIRKKFRGFTGGAVG